MPQPVKSKAQPSRLPARVLMLSGAPAIAVLALARMTMRAPAATAAVTVQAQDTTSAEEPPQTIYSREKLVFPSDNRRNPFVPLWDDAGPDFEDLDLVGIILGSSEESVATLIDRANGKRHTVRRGDLVGNAGVVEIRADAVVFRVTEFGVMRSETLRIGKDEDTPNPGESP